MPLDLALAGGKFSEAGKNTFEHRQCIGHLFRTDDEIPKRLKLLPAGGVGKVASLAPQTFFVARPLPDGGPTIEVTIGAPVAGF